MDFKDAQIKLDEIEKQRQEILKQVTKAGGTIVENKILKPEDEIYVVESMWYGETQDESTGYYHIIHHTEIMSDKLLNDIKTFEKIKTEDELKEAFLEFFENNVEFNELWGKNIPGFDYVDKENICGISNNKKEYHDKVNDFILDVFLEDEYSGKEWHGYMSFYSMPKEDFDKIQNIDVDFSKYLTWN